MELISVIVPVYKVEAYLDKCISSILSQTHSNLELILVDDGSPDRSGEICDAWAAKDSRIRVIHQKNAGGGAARNAALDAAEGALIAFVDSDDYLAPEMLVTMKAYMMPGVDLVECGFVSVPGDDASFSTQVQMAWDYTAQEAMEAHIHDRYFRQLIWNKLYRRHLLDGVRFPEEKGIDDEFFTYQAIGRAGKLVRIDAVLYAYRQQQSSVMHTLDMRQRLQAVKAKTERHHYIKRHMPQLESVSGRALWYTCMYQGQLALRDGDSVQRKQVLAFLREVLRQNPVLLNDAAARDRLWFALARISFDMTCRLRNLLRIGL